MQLPACADQADPSTGLIRLGVADVGTPHQRPFTMPADELDHHLLISGPAGDQRSRLMLAAAVQAAAAPGRYPILVLDTSGEAVHQAAELLWEHYPDRREDLVLADLATRHQVALFNPLDVRSPTDVSAAVNASFDVLVAVSHIHPRRSCVDGIRLALQALCEANLTLTGSEYRANVSHLNAFLSHAEFRAGVIARCSDPRARAFYAPGLGTFDRMEKPDRVKLLSCALNATAALEPFPYPLCHALASRFELAPLLSRSKIVLVRLAGGGAESCALASLGALLAEQAAAGRCRIVLGDALSMFTQPGRAGRFLADAAAHGAGVIAALDSRSDRTAERRRAGLVAEWVSGCRSRLSPMSVGPGFYANVSTGRGLTGPVFAFGEGLTLPTPLQRAAVARCLRQSGYPFTTPRVDRRQLNEQLTRTLTRETLRSGLAGCLDAARRLVPRPTLDDGDSPTPAA
jgi:hypothetical protein